MRVVLIGRGRLATSLLAALQQAGHEVVSINSRTLEGLPMEADVFVVSVKDSALKDVISLATKGREQQLFVHTAGSMPMSLFDGYTSRCGVFYPMQTFSKNRPVDFKQIPCFIEASDHQALETIQVLATSVSDCVMHVGSEKRKKLHLAAVLCCNLANHCYRLAEQVLEEEGIDFSLFVPLIEETAQKVKSMSPRQAQTGPMVRYDVNIMQMQQRMLTNERTREIYRLMAESIHEDAVGQNTN